LHGLFSSVQLLAPRRTLLERRIGIRTCFRASLRGLSTK
jgi:hypothetical protein